MATCPRDVFMVFSTIWLFMPFMMPMASSIEKIPRDIAVITTRERRLFLQRFLHPIIKNIFICFTSFPVSLQCPYGFNRVKFGRTPCRENGEQHGKDEGDQPGHSHVCHCYRCRKYCCAYPPHGNLVGVG